MNIDHIDRLIEGMEAAGCDPAQIVSAVKHHLAHAREELTAYRAKRAAAKRAERDKCRTMSHDVAATDCDNTHVAATSSPPSPPASSPEVLPPGNIYYNNTPPLLTPTPPTSPSPPRGAQARGTRLPAGWEPDEAGRAFAADGLGVQWGTELETFRDYWSAQPGEKGRKVDWSATWRNWVRRARAREISPYRAYTAPARKPSLAEKYARMAMEMDNEPGSTTSSTTFDQIFSH